MQKKWHRCEKYERKVGCVHVGTNKKAQNNKSEYKVRVKSSASACIGVGALLGIGELTCESRLRYFTSPREGFSMSEFSAKGL